MTKSPTTIELNGKRYDARTGAILSGEEIIDAGSSSSVQQDALKISPQVTAPRSSGGQNLDGFIRKHNAEKPQLPKTQPHHAHRAPQKSKTLMRPAVSKPDIPKPDISRVRKPKLNPVINHARINRAETVSRSPHVSKFSHHSVSTIVKKEAHLPVVEPTLSAVRRGVTNELHKLEDALKEANSHLHELEANAIQKIPFLQRVGFKNKFANLSAMTAGVLLLVGFFAYQNYAQFSVRVASVRAGVEASIPDYKPTGFGVGREVKYQPGSVTIDFNSRTDDRHFAITQQASNWNSSSLLANYVNKDGCQDCYETWQSDGRTVFIYNDTNATWVDGGIWYKIEGNAQLTSDQLLRIASSL